jgi:hypothetical protein
VSGVASAVESASLHRLGPKHVEATTFSQRNIEIVEGRECGVMNPLTLYAMLDLEGKVNLMS